MSNENRESLMKLEKILQRIPPEVYTKTANLTLEGSVANIRKCLNQPFFGHSYAANTINC